MASKFKVKDHVVYPIHGVGIIESTYDKEVNAKNTLFLKVKMKESGMFISIPSDNADQMGLRKVIKKNEIAAILKKLTVYPDKIEENWKLRFQENIEKLKTGEIDSIVTVVKELYIRNKIKNLSIMERKQFEGAFKMLVKEIAISSDTDEKEANDLVSSKLDALGAVHDKGKKS